MIRMHSTRRSRVSRSLTFLLPLVLAACGGSGSATLGGGDDAEDDSGDDTEVGSGAVAPEGLEFDVDDATYVVGLPISSNVPTLDAGSAVTYSILPTLPSGLTLSSTTGAITGTPVLAASDRSYTVTAANQAGSATATLSIEVVPADTPLGYPLSESGYTQNFPFEVEPTGTGSDATFAVVSGSLPAGVTLDGDSGALRGRLLSSADPAPFTVEVTDPAESRSTTVDFDAPVAPVARLAFALHGADSTLSVYRVDADGGLRQRGALATTTGLARLAASADGSLLAGANPSDGTVLVWSISAEGGVRALSGSPVDVTALGADGAPDRLCVDPTARFVYAADGGAIVLLTADTSAGTVAASATVVDTGATTLGGLTVDPSGSYLYAMGDDDVIYAYSVDATTGALAPLTPATFTAVGAAGELLHVRNGDYLVRADETAGTLNVYAVDAQGRLSPTAALDVVALLGGGRPRELDAPADGGRLDVRFDDGTLASFAVDPASGALTATSLAPVTAGAGTTRCASTPDGAALIVLDGAATTVGAHAFNGSGVVGATPVSTTLTGPAAAELEIVAGRPAATTNLVAVYTAAAFGNGVDHYGYDAGVLTPFAPDTRETGVFPSSLAVHPWGEWLYAATGDGIADVQRFPIDADGALGVAVSQDLSGSFSGLIIEPNGHRAFGLSTGGMTTLGIDPATGAMTVGASAAAGLLPRWSALHSSGRLLWVAPLFGLDLVRIQCDPATGALTAAGTTTLTGASLLLQGASEPSGRFFYVIDLLGDVFGYAVDPADGELTPLAGSPFSPLAAQTGSPVGLVANPIGGSLVAAFGTGTAGSLVRFTIDADTGELTAEAAVALASAASALAFAGGGEVLLVSEAGGLIEAVDASGGALVPSGTTTAALGGAIALLDRTE